MKQAFLLVLTIFIVTVATAQKRSAIDKAVDSTCKCLEAVKAKIKSPEDFDKYGEGCVIKSAIPFLPEIAKEEKIPLDELGDDDEIGDKMGKKIGLKLVTDCPVFLELVAQYSGEDDEDEGEVTGKLKGTVTSVEAGDHLYINVKEETGKIVKLVWLQYFPGVDDFKSSPDALKGKKVSVQWKQVEVYAVKQKDFVTVKQVVKLAVE